MALHDDSQDETVAPLDPRSARLLAAAAVPRALPEGLRSRLLALPAAAEGEEMQVRRYERARAAALSGQPLAAPASRAEQAIAGWLDPRTTAAGRRPAGLPAALRQRLLAIGRGGRKKLPFWLVDPRVAAVACLILTLLSTVLVEDASALLAGKTIEVRLAPQEWPERAVGELSGQLAGRRDRTLAAARAAWRSGEQALLSRAEGFAEGLRDSCEEKLRQFRQTELGRRLAGEPSQQGKNDGDR